MKKIIEGKYYEQELLKSDFGFESNKNFGINKYRPPVISPQAG